MNHKHDTDRVIEPVGEAPAARFQSMPPLSPEALHARMFVRAALGIGKPLGDGLLHRTEVVRVKREELAGWEWIEAARQLRQAIDTEWHGDARELERAAEANRMQLGRLGERVEGKRGTGTK